MLVDFDVLDFVARDVEEALENAKMELMLNKSEALNDMHVDAIEALGIVQALLLKAKEENGYRVTPVLIKRVSHLDEYLDTSLYLKRLRDPETFDEKVDELYDQYRNLRRLFGALNTKNS